VLDANQSNDRVIVYWPKGSPNQLWEFEGDGTIRSEIGKVLDVYKGRTQSGTPLIAYPKHGEWNQIFRMVPVD
jgi:hypothetical protein